MIITKELLALASAAAEKYREQQRDAIPEGAMRVAPNTDALAWRIWPKDGSEL